MRFIEKWLMTCEMHVIQTRVRADLLDPSLFLRPPEGASPGPHRYFPPSVAEASVDDGTSEGMVRRLGFRVTE